MEIVTIKRVSSTDKKKDGTELIGKYGKFYRVGIQTEEYGDEWLNGFTSNEPNWIEGSKVEVIVFEEEWNGIMKKKFKLPSKKDKEEAKDAEIEELKAKLAEKE